MVLGFSGQQLKCVGDHAQHSFEALGRTPWGPWNVEDETISDRTRPGPAQGGHRCLLQTACQHGMHKSGRFFLEYGRSGLGGHIAVTESRAAGSHHQPGSRRCLDYRCRNPVNLIGNEGATNGEAMITQKIGQCSPGEILPNSC